MTSDASQDNNKLLQNLFPLDHLHMVHFFAISIENLSYLTNFQ